MFRITPKELSQMPDMETAYPEYVLSKDGQVYHLSDLYEVNALPGKIDDNSVVVPLYNI